MTIQLYLRDTYLFHSKNVILKMAEDEKGKFIILDETIFYPQGGGQASDQGIIQNNHFKAKIYLARQLDGEVRHYIESLIGEVILNLKVDCFISKEIRILNSRYHTAGHLLGNIVELLYPEFKAVKGHSFPKEAYIEFNKMNLIQDDSVIDLDKIQSSVDEAILKNYQTKVFEINHISFGQQFYKLPYIIPENKNFRVMQIGSMLPVPCGGTHLSFIGEIKHFAVTKYKIKNNILRISYEVE